MLKKISPIAFLPVLFFAFSSHAEENSKKSEVIGLLSGYEYEAGQEEWNEVGPDAKLILMEITGDTGQKKIIKARAILALAYFPDNETRQFLLNLVSDEKQDEKFIRKGLYALSSGFGKAVLADLGGFLSHENPDIRDASVRAISKIVCKKSLKLLKKRLKVEKNEMVREVLKKKIKYLKNRLKKKND